MNPVRTVADGRSTGKLSRADVIENLQLYYSLYGECVSASFNPSTARWRGREDLVERYYGGRPDGRPWPSLNAMKRLFGNSFNEALRAADLPIPKSGPVRKHAEPVRDVRIQRVMVESDRDRELRMRIDVLERQRDRARDRADRAETLYAELRARRADPRRRGEPKTVTKPVVKTVTKTVTKTVRKVEKVRDRKVEDRLRSKLADAEARARAFDDQIQMLSRDLTAARRDAQSMASQAAERAREAQDADRATKGLRDRADAAETLVARLRAELAELQMVDSDARERASVSDLVASAERRADEAERRAARAERVAVEHAHAATGQPRVLTRDELNELRSKGPAGPAVMADAFKALARARKDGNKLDAALLDVARAALTWRDRIR